MIERLAIRRLEAAATVSGLGLCSYSWCLPTMAIVAAPPCSSAVMPDQTPSELGKAILELIRQNEGQIGWHEIAKALHANSHRRRAAIYRQLKRLERTGTIRRETIDGVVRFFIVKPDGDGEHVSHATGKP
jgi:hypothetical protein